MSKMERQKIKKIAVMTSGGDAPGLNVFIRAVPKKEFVLCKELCNKPGLLSIANIPEQRKKSVMNEAHTLCKGIHQ